MKKITIFAILFFISFLNVSVRAETALAQLPPKDSAAQQPLPTPELVFTGRVPLLPEEAVKKLPLFDYQKSDVISVTRSTPSVHKNYTVETIELLVNDPLRQLGQFTQTYRIYKTRRPGPHPAVLISPPFVPQKLDQWSAMDFVRKGYDAVVITPCESLTDTTRPLDKISNLLIRNTIMIRMAIDLLETFPEVDSSRIYAYGISMGSIRTSLAFGVEPRIKKAMGIVGGGDIPGIITDTRFKLLESVRDTRMRIEGIATLEEFRAYLEKTMIVDPLDFASLRNPEDIFLVIGHGDRFVRDPYQEKLFQAFSRPAEGRYPSVKRSIVGHLPTAAKFDRYIDLFIKFIER